MHARWQIRACDTAACCEDLEAGAGECDSNSAPYSAAGSRHHRDWHDFSLVRDWSQIAMRFALALLALTLLAQQKQKFELTEVQATGCVRRDPNSDCLLLQTLDGQTTYAFVATPKPDLDTVITIQGKAHKGKSMCRQGIAIDIVDWEPTDQMCAQPAPKK
jgi:hypothetical protein